MDESKANRLQRIIDYFSQGYEPFLNTERLEGYKARLKTYPQSPLINGLLNELDKLEAYTIQTEWEREEIAQQLLKTKNENETMKEEIKELWRYVEICINQSNGK